MNRFLSVIAASAFLAGCASAPQSQDKSQDFSHVKRVGGIYLGDTPIGRGQTVRPKSPAIVEQAPTTKAETVGARWTIKTTDRTLRETFNRWARTGGWQLSWELTKDISISAEASFDGGLESAITQALESLRGSSTTAEACMYSNKVVRVVSSNLVCEVAKNEN